MRREMNQQRSALPIAAIHTQHRQYGVDGPRLARGLAGFIIMMPSAVVCESFEPLRAETDSGRGQVFGGFAQSLSDGAAHGVNHCQVACAELQLPEFLRV